MKTLADKIISFINTLDFKGTLPHGVKIMNPCKEPLIKQITAQFYRKFYSDNNPRHIILGINPGRHGAGLTGITFTDTKRLAEYCGIEISEFKSHEPSSVFFYEVIKAYGGADKFYKDFYVGAVCPLGFTMKNPNGREINYNYYGSKELYKSVYGFIVKSLRKQLDFNLKRNICICLGNNANYKHLSKINEKERVFEKIIPLEHPRFIMQYKLKHKQQYINKYLTILKEITGKK